MKASSKSAKSPRPTRSTDSTGQRLRSIGESLNRISRELLTASRSSREISSARLDQLEMGSAVLRELTRTGPPLPSTPTPTPPQPQSLSLGPVSISPEGTRVTLPGGSSVTLDEKGVSVDVPAVGNVHLGGNGVVVTRPDGGKVGVGTDGSVTLPGGSVVRPPSLPTDGGAPGGSGFSFPMPSFEFKPMPISIQIPELVVKPLPISIPMLELCSKPFSFPISFPTFPGLPSSFPPGLPSSFPWPELNFPAGYDPAQWSSLSLVHGRRDAALAAALARALQLWKTRARFDALRVTAASAFGSPGCFTGPDLEALLRGEIAGAAVEDRPLFQAMALAVSKNVRRWAEHVTVPGLPWYPIFVAYPGPEAPPTPNIPTPIALCPSASLGQLIVPTEIETAIRTEFTSQGGDGHAVPALTPLCVRLALVLAHWLATYQVMGVFGRGPVPSFAPPAVPVGPVINGVAASM